MIILNITWREVTDFYSKIDRDIGVIKVHTNVDLLALILPEHCTHDVINFIICLIATVTNVLRLFTELTWSPRG